MMILGRKIAAKVVGMVVTAVVIVLLLTLLLDQCSRKKTAGKEAEVAEGQQGAALDSGSEAMNTVSNVAASDAATDALVGMGQAEIAAASQGSKGKAAKKAACRLRAYVDSPQCKEAVR